jgi:hypothetical protein
MAPCGKYLSEKGQEDCQEGSEGPREVHARHEENGRRWWCQDSWHRGGNQRYPRTRPDGLIGAPRGLRCALRQHPGNLRKHIHQ